METKYTLTMNKKIFKGIMPALITPFDVNGNLKKDSVGPLIDWLLSQGVKGFYILGGTGEGPALRKELRMEMAEACIQANRKRSVIIDHIGAPNIHDAIELTRHADSIGVDAVSSLPPTYSFHYTEDQLVDYYKAIADNTDKPVIVYATSMLGGINVLSLMRRLLKTPNIIGAKFTMPDYFLMHKITELNEGNINVINGPDETLLCGLAMGADGGIGTTYNVMANWFVKLYDAFQAGQFKEAQSWQYRINKVIDALIRHSSSGAIMAVKETLNMMGFDTGNAIFPANPFTKEESLSMKKELESLGISFN